MLDAIIDTNVLIVASLAHAGVADQSHRLADECLRVFEWLEEFRQSSASVVLDNDMQIFDEYYNKLSGQDYGVLVIHEKLGNSCRLHPIEYTEEHDRAAVVPPRFANLDRSDRKFLAVALADLEDGNESEIVNATDTDDWRLVEAECAAHGVTVHHLLED